MTNKKIFLWIIMLLSSSVFVNSITYDLVLSQNSTINNRGLPRCQGFKAPQTTNYGMFKIYLTTLTSHGQIRSAVYSGLNTSTDLIGGCNITTTTSGNCGGGAWCGSNLTTGSCFLNAGTKYYVCWYPMGSLVAQPTADGTEIYLDGCERSISNGIIGGCNTNYDFSFRIYNTSATTTQNDNNITIIFPNNTLIINNDINITYNVTQTMNNCSLYTNQTGSWIINQTTNNVLNNTNQTFDISIIPEGTISYGIQCFSSDLIIHSSNNRTLTHDISNPVITINNNNFFDVNNNSVINQYLNSVLINISYTDNNDLFAHEINISKSDGTTYYYIKNNSLSGRKGYNFTTPVNISSWPAGVYDINILASDSHTARMIKDYEISSRGNSILFLTAEGNKVTISDYSAINTFYQRKRDRYNYGFRYGNIKSLRTYDLKSNNKIFYLPKSGYNAHFIIMSRKDKGNWVDFEGAGKDYVVTRINDYHYRITFLNIKKGIVTFKSIGGLNIVSKKYQWYRGNYTQEYSSQVLSGSTNLFSINISDNKKYLNTINATIIYNNTQYVLNVINDTGFYYFSKNIGSPSASSTTTITSYFNISITQKNGSVYNYSVDNSQTVKDYNISECSTGETQIINLTFYDEDEPGTKLTTDIEGFISYYANNNSLNKHYNFTKKNINSYGLCSSTNNTITINAYFRYTYEQGFTHRYYIINTNFSNTTKYYELYNHNSTTGISLLKGTVVWKSNYTNAVSIYSALLRYFPGSNTYRIVQMDKTGDYGTITYNVIEKSTDYKILFIDEKNRSIKQTRNLKFACDTTTNVCEVTFQIEPYATIAGSTNLQIRDHYNNNTGIWQINWTDNTGLTSSVRVVITKETMTGTTLICNTEVLASSGSIECDTTGYTGKLFLSLYSSASPERPILRKWIEGVTDKISAYIPIVMSGYIAFGIILTGTMFGVGISPAAAIIGLLFGLINIYMMGLLDIITGTIMIIVCILGVIIALVVRR